MYMYTTLLFSSSCISYVHVPHINKALNIFDSNFKMSIASLATWRSAYEPTASPRSSHGEVLLDQAIGLSCMMTDLGTI